MPKTIDRMTETSFLFILIHKKARPIHIDRTPK